LTESDFAPGWPGIEPRWTSSAKEGIGTAMNAASRVWFTLSHGIFNEIYYPRLDQACTRDMGMLVASSDGFFSEEKRCCMHAVTLLAPGVPAYRLDNTCESGRYRIEKEIVTDPCREVVLQQTRFNPLVGPLGSYRVFALLAPHIGNRGWGNTGWISSYKGIPMLFAERDGICLAVACSEPWLRRSAGFVGVSDGWQDISRHKEMTQTYRRAENGNIALTGEIDIRACAGAFTIAIGFGRNAAEAGNRVRASLLEGFAKAQDQYIWEWREWQDTLLGLERGHSTDQKQDTLEPYRISTAVIRTHEARNLPGGIIAGLSIPWGFSKTDEDLGGYHLVWPRDLVESAAGLLAAGDHESVCRVLRYLQSTQEADGHWPQNMWLDGTPYWNGIQIDETAFPILLTDLAYREGSIGGEKRVALWPMVKAAASFILRNGPVTQQDRWEEDPGYSPFTLAAEIAALLVAAELADEAGEPAAATYLRETADAWNDNIERWIYVTDSETAKKHKVTGFYVRIAPPEVSDASSPAAGFITIKNRPPGNSREAADMIVSPDALALVRFGLRAPDDPRIVETVKVIDALLRVETPFGPAWHRYNGDGYGEHADGAAFDGTGIGRLWPLITGERAHFELAAGRRAEAERLADAMAAFAGRGGLIPEQIWDSPDIPSRELYCGRPSGSAMPLVWAHAEYVKLCRSLRDLTVFDTPPQTVKRYVVEKKTSLYTIWRMNQKCRTIPSGRTLRVETTFAGIVRWKVDGMSKIKDFPLRCTGLGLHTADLPTAELSVGSKMVLNLVSSNGSGRRENSFPVEVIRNDFRKT